MSIKSVIVRKEDVKSRKLLPDVGVSMKELISEKTPSQQCFMGYCWIDPGCSSPSKPRFVEHETEELYYVLYGRAEVVYEGDKKHLLEPGHAVLHPVGLRHRLDNNFDEPFVFLFFYPTAGHPEITEPEARTIAIGEK